MAADGKPYTTLVFGNGSTPRNDTATGARADLTNVDTSGDKDYKQQVAVQLSSETHGGGDVILMAAGAGSKVFKGSLDNTKVFGLMRQAFGF
jgi:alkaline phosphatase